MAEGARLVYEPDMPQRTPERMRLVYEPDCLWSPPEGPPAAIVIPINLQFQQIHL